MTQKLPWTPWHRVVKLREDVRSGELSLADFAADLHDVMMQRGARPIYEDPARFFALTYPTFSLRELARDVVLRLAGRNTKAVRQLELTYGGGKTQTLVALRHLAHDPASLPSLPAVDEAWRGRLLDFFSVSVPGGDEGRPLRARGLAARLGPGQERRHRQGDRRPDRRERGLAVRLGRGGGGDAEAAHRVRPHLRRTKVSEPRRRL